MTANLNSLREYICCDDGLGSLSHRQAQIEQTEWQRRIVALSEGYVELRATGRMDEAAAVKRYGAELIEKRWGL